MNFQIEDNRLARADRSGRGWTMEFIGERGSVITRNAHDRFELWGAHPEFEPIECQFPKPWLPRSAMVDARAWETGTLLEEGEE